MKDEKKKFAELIIYVSQLHATDEAFGVTKLNKILFFADFTAYMMFGQSITGQQYFRLPEGPAPTQLLPVRASLVKAKRLALNEVPYYTRKQLKPIALDRADLSVFTPDEIAIVSQVALNLWGKDASECSGLSHKFVGWLYAKDREIIPYEVALIANQTEPTPSEIGTALGLLPYAKEALSA
jgi:hypothetical protein